MTEEHTQEYIQAKVGC